VYACRAGTETSRFWGADPIQACEHENVADQTPQRQWNWARVHNCDDGYSATAAVGTFQPSGFGLHDMLGNASEWCQDVYRVDVYSKHERVNPLHVDESAGSERVVRGGHWHAEPAAVLCADRGSASPGASSETLGFRLIREE
jgi:formylglycine-generating enzyme required for sulfatase activity